MENHEAVVTYDPNLVTIQNLLDAVKNAKGINRYTATVKTMKK